MAIGLPSSPETASPASPSEETKKDSDDSKDKKKKSTGSLAVRAEVAQAKASGGEKPQPAAAHQPTALELAWQKIIGERSQAAKAKPEKTADKAVLPVIPAARGSSPGPVIRPAKLPEFSYETDEAAAMARARQPDLERLRQAQERSGETAAQEQLRQAAREITEVRLRAADHELHELPLDALDSLQAAEAAAGLALLSNLQERLDNPDQEAADAVEAAGQEVTARLEAAAAADEPPVEAIPAEMAEAPENAGGPGAAEGEDRLERSLADGADDEAGGARPATEAGGGRGGAERPPEPPGGREASGGPEDTPAAPPPRGPAGPPEAPPPPDFGPGFGPPYGPDFRRDYEADPSPAGRGAESSAVIPVDEALGAERTAMGRGLLVGGIIGYFSGRRRGRKQGRAAAEKQFALKQRTHERQVSQLQASISAKESQIKQLASEKFAALTHVRQRKHLISELLRPRREARPAKASGMMAEQFRPAAAGAVAETAAGRRIVPTAAEAAAIAGGAILAESGLVPGQRARGYGDEAAAIKDASKFNQNRAAFEALRADSRYDRRPGTAVLQGTGRQGGERHQAAAAGEQLGAGKRAEPQPLIHFHKRAEEFSRTELMLAAEKVKVQGTTLKEMVDLGRLDEPGLRRTIGEFLRGGDVSAAVAREVKERELKFERDPRLRRAAAGSGGLATVGGGLVAAVAALGGAALVEGSRILPSRPTDGSLAATPGQPPVPDAATLKSLRARQMTAISGGVLVVILVILLIILFAIHLG